MVIGLEPILWNGISIMPIQLAMPVDALLYPSNPQAGIELHHNRKEHCWVVRLQVDTTQTLAAMPLPIECVVMAGALLPCFRNISATVYSDSIICVSERASSQNRRFRFFTVNLTLLNRLP